MTPTTLPVFAHDADWQYPAITERHAFERVKVSVPFAPDTAYLAFPWATLLDRLNEHRETAWLRASLSALSDEAAGYGRVVTVCQHILLPKFREVLADHGVTDVFWSHAVKDGDTLAGSGLNTHPFPLFPAQYPTGPVASKPRTRDYLFSFVGSKATEWYLSEVRTWLLEELAGHARGYVLSRDEWHFSKIVYDLQVREAAASADGLVDDEAAQLFKDVLQRSVFSLCPSGTGPNSIRLWESLMAGAIPVVLSDRYLPPGPAALWQEAALFVQEDREAVRSLPERLEAIAGDAQRLEAMQAAGRQLSLLYGPDDFVYDVRAFVFARATTGGVEDGGASGARVASLPMLADHVLRSRLANTVDNRFLLASACTDLLVDPEGSAGLLSERSDILRTLGSVAASIPDDPLTERLDVLLHQAGIEKPDATAPPGSGAPVVGRAKPKVCLLGRHGQFTPFAHQRYRPLFERELDYTERLEDADAIVTGFEVELSASARRVADSVEHRPHQKLFVFSEEPLWDTVWTADPQASSARVKGTELAVAVFNHQNSDIYSFEQVPYFLTTQDRYALRYAAMMGRNAELDTDELLAAWKARSVRIAHFAEHRTNPRYAVRWNDELFGLSVFRTELAEAVRNEAAGSSVIVRGKNWTSEAARDRRVLPDWHLEKLAEVGGDVRALSSLENTHAPGYVTEKLFDAFAALAIPLYCAGPTHRVRELLPDEAYLNVFGLSPMEAAERVLSFEPSRGYASAYLAAQAELAQRFANAVQLASERDRVVRASMQALHAVL